MSTETFNLGDAIRKVRAIEAKKKAMDDAHEAKTKPFKDYANGLREQILAHLLRTGQKSAQTEHGGTYWKERTTYPVEDKDEFRQFVISENAWQLLTWAAAPLAAEEYTQEHAAPPPGTKRNAINILHITAPTKANAKTKGNGAAHPTEQESEQVSL